MRNVPLFGVGTSGKSTNVVAQSRENVYVEVAQDQESNGLSMFATPGLTTFVNLGANPCRGVYSRGDVMYAVNAATLWEIAADGTATNRGTLLTNGGRVDMTDNGTQLLIVDGTYGYSLTFVGSVFAQVTDIDYPASETCTFLNQYAIVQKTDSGKFYVSAAGDVTAWDALDFATAESDPDNLVRVMADSGTLILFGERTTEFWGDSGSLDFPFTRIGASAIEWGLAAKWSLCKYTDSLMFLRKNRLGAVQVCRLRGMSADVVSTPDLDYLFSTYSSVENATAFTYMVSGHPMYCINFPSEGVSWEFDGLSNEWHRRSSGAASARHRGEVQVNFQNLAYVTDWENGKIYLIDQTNDTDDGATIVREFVTRHNKSGEYTEIPKLWLEVEAGVGLVSGQGSDPLVMLQVSRDGGHTWGPVRTAKLGAIGEYGKRALWLRLGRARDWLFKFRVTDPVKTVFVAAWAEVH